MSYTEVKDYLSNGNSVHGYIGNSVIDYILYLHSNLEY